MTKSTPTERKTDVAFYNSAAWRRTSAAIRAENPVCVVCIHAQRANPATVVDHIVPVKFGGARLNRGNLMAMCSSCHNYKSARETKSPLIHYAGTFGEYMPTASLEAIVKILENKI